MRTGTIEVPGGALAYDESGDGPAVVLVHPGLWDRRTWDDQMSSFPAAGFRTIRFDVRGYGGSTRPTGEPYSHVRDLIAVMDQLDVREAAIVGCSMGGAIAIDATLEHPDRVWSLVPVAAGLGGFESTQEEDDWWGDIDEPIEAAIATGDLETAQDLRLRIWAPLGTDDEAGRRIRAIAFDNLHELEMDESGAEDLDPPAAHRLQEIDVPTLVIKAGHDPADMRRISDVLAAGVVGARIVTIDDADHVVNVRTPNAFDRTVLGFLDEHRP